MTPTGSWPTMRPGATGYSPRRMCTSVPQMVVIVTRTIASVGPHTGTGRSRSRIWSAPSKTAARIVSVAFPADGRSVVGTADMATLPRVGSVRVDATNGSATPHPRAIPLPVRATTERGQVPRPALRRSVTDTRSGAGIHGCRWLARDIASSHPTSERRSSTMSSLHPRVPKDLALAPVAAEIDLNLQFLRDHAPEQIEYELDVTLDRPAAGNS